MKRILTVITLIGLIGNAYADKSATGQPATGQPATDKSGTDQSGTDQSAKKSSSGIYSIDREAIVAGSKEGKAFLKSQEQNKVNAEKELRDMEQEIRLASQRLEKQVSMLSKDAIMTKQKKLAKDIRNLERERQDRQDDPAQGLPDRVLRTRILPHSLSEREVCRDAALRGDLQRGAGDAHLRRLARGEESAVRLRPAQRGRRSLDGRGQEVRR